MAGGWPRWRLRNGPAARADLYNNMADLLEAGVPEREMLTLVHQAVSEGGQERGRPAARAVEAWSLALEEAEPFDVAVAGWVPASEALLFSGAAEGKRVEALRQAAELAETEGALRKAVVGNLIYPAVLFGMAVFLVWLMGGHIIPVLTDARPDAEWRGFGAHLITASRILDDFGPLVLAGLTAGVAGVLWSLPRWVGGARVWFDHNLPPFTTYRIIQETSFLLALAAQMQAGGAPHVAIADLARQASPWLRQRLLALLTSIDDGQNLAVSMEMAGYRFPCRDVVGQISVFERAGTLTDRLPKMARTRVNRAVAQVKGQMGTINLLLMGVIAMVIAGIGLGLIDLMDQASSGVR